MAADLAAGAGAAHIAARFHATLIAQVLAAARHCAARRVVLAGGCFQNRLLLQGCIDALRAAGITPHWPRRIPSNDGGIAVGQLVAAARVEP